jgi:formamidopyrimidine-DNA glycosylase
MSNGLFQVDHGTQEALLASHKRVVNRLRSYVAGKPCDYDNAFLLIEHTRKELSETEETLLSRYGKDVSFDTDDLARSALEQYANQTMNRVQQCIIDGSFYCGVGNAFAHADLVLQKASEAGVQVEEMNRRFASMKKGQRFLA